MEAQGRSCGKFAWNNSTSLEKHASDIIALNSAWCFRTCDEGIRVLD